MAGILTKEEWLKRKRRRTKLMILAAAALFIIISVLILMLIMKILSGRHGAIVSEKETLTAPLPNKEEIQIDYLTPNPYSRPQTRLKRIKGIVVHYTANPGTTADNNRSYFEGLKSTKATSASSHFIIGLDGEIIQCIPLTEISYASNDRNNDTVSIECCHEDSTGQFNEETYASLVSLTAALCCEYGLDKEDVIRHYDVSGKLCPLYFVDHEDAWEAFKDAVGIEIEEMKASKEEADEE